MSFPFVYYVVLLYYPVFLLFFFFHYIFELGIFYPLDDCVNSLIVFANFL